MLCHDRPLSTHVPSGRPSPFMPDCQPCEHRGSTVLSHPSVFTTSKEVLLTNQIFYSYHATLGSSMASCNKGCRNEQTFERTYLMGNSTPCRFDGFFFYGG